MVDAKVDCWVAWLVDLTVVKSAVSLVVSMAARRAAWTVYCSVVSKVESLAVQSAAA